MRDVARAHAVGAVQVAVGLLATGDLTAKRLADEMGYSLSWVHRYCGSTERIHALALAEARSQCLDAIRGVRAGTVEQVAAQLALALTPPVRWRAWAMAAVEDPAEFIAAFEAALARSPAAWQSSRMAWGLYTQAHGRPCLEVRQALTDLVVGPAVLFSRRLGGGDPLRQ